MKNVIWSGLGAVLAAWSSLSLAAGEVKLINATSQVENDVQVQTIRFEATVKNLAPHKQVFAHYKAADGKWVDAPLTFNRLGDGTNEVWATTIRQAPQSTFDVQFALRYVVNGQTFWDNNNGQNYFVGKDSGVLLAPDVNVASWGHIGRFVTGPGGPVRLGGVIALRNLAPTKDVTVKYTTDNWTTIRTARASFAGKQWGPPTSSASNPNEYGVEMWHYDFEVPALSRIQYAIQYVVNGQTFWDNNFGRNFQIDLVETDAKH